MASIKKILPPQPHYLSGYTGYVPGYKFHSGQSYGRLTHDLFLDPTIQRSDIPVLTDLFKVRSNELSQEEKTLLENRCNFRKCNYGDDITSSYKGYVPQSKFLCGNNFKVKMTMALNLFEKMKRQCLCSECREMRSVNQNIHEQTEDFNEYTHPFKKIPGSEEIIKKKYKTLPAKAPSTKAYFLKNEDSQKSFMTGYTGHVPNLIDFNGISYNPATNEALKLFSTRYDKFKINSMEPDALKSVNDYSQPKYASRKFRYEDGIMKNYAGHIPGDKFNVGKTFSEGSKNTRNILRQEQVTVNYSNTCKL